mgnify:CR=1 FL=1
MVFSDETLGTFRDYDAPSYEAIRRAFLYAQAGADLLHIEIKGSPEEIERIVVNVHPQVREQMLQAKASGEIAAWVGEDSGSAYLAARDSETGVATSVAGQPRNPQ